MGCEMNRVGYGNVLSKSGVGVKCRVGKARPAGLWFICMLSMLAGCARHQSNCLEITVQEVLCQLSDSESTITVYCDGTYRWQQDYGMPRIRAGRVPAEYLVMIKASVGQDRRFRDVGGVPVYTYSNADSFSAHPQGVGELLGYVWQEQGGEGVE